MVASSFDRPFEILTTDLGPYVRSIVAYDQRLEAKRVQMSNLLSVGGNGSKTRRTRSAFSAMEGGKRNQTRRERWFDATLELNYALVMRTAGPWGGIGAETGEDGFEDISSIQSGSSP